MPKYIKYLMEGQQAEEYKAKKDKERKDNEDIQAKRRKRRYYSGAAGMLPSEDNMSYTASDTGSKYNSRNKSFYKKYTSSDDKTKKEAIKKADNEKERINKANNLGYKEADKRYKAAVGGTQVAVSPSDKDGMKKMEERMKKGKQALTTRDPDSISAIDRHYRRHEKKNKSQNRNESVLIEINII